MKNLVWKIARKIEAKQVEFRLNYDYDTNIISAKIWKDHNSITISDNKVKYTVRIERDYNVQYFTTKRNRENMCEYILGMYREIGYLPPLIGIDHD